MTIREHCVIGPPGCGKSTKVAASVAESARRRGYDKVLVTSFTKAAAAEIASRDMPIPDHMVGTLHAHAYRSIGSPPVAETMLDEWNEAQPAYARSGGRTVDVADPLAESKGATEADKLAAEMDLLRARRVPVEHWPYHVAAYGAKWRAWCAEVGAVDFAGMIEEAIAESIVAPGNPEVMFVDEAQDCSALDMALIRHWAAHTELVTYVGDPDQTLYQWRGADPAHMIETDIEGRKVLDHSYRLPAKIHANADAWIRRSHHRAEIDWHPRDGDDPGTVGIHPAATWRMPERLVADAAEIADSGRTVMILATAGYMLAPTIARLRAEGIGFHNPGAPRRGDWNPLARARGTTSGHQRLRAFCVMRDDHPDQHFWRPSEAASWLELLDSKRVLVRGAKAAIAKLAATEGAGMTNGYMAALFRDPQDYYQHCISGDLDWFARSVTPSKAKALELPRRMIERSGLADLPEPKIMVGTVHSAKGMEASAVYLYPDMAPQMRAQWFGGPASQDAVRRVYYVGCTRSRDALTIAQPGGFGAIDPGEITAGAREWERNL